MVSFTNRVLIVEDDPVSRNFLELALAKMGYAVIGAQDAAEAEDQLAPPNMGTFSCVVTDYRMPLRNGLELLAWIRERDPSLAAILVTANGEKQVVAESLRGGAVDFLDKPVDLKMLESAVARAVQRTHRQRRLRDSESAVQDLGRLQHRMLSMDAFSSSGAVEVCSFPKHDAGGDFFSCFQPEQHRLFCLLTDVSGHDLPAAYISAYFQGLVRGLMSRGANVRDIFSEFNRFLLEEWNRPEHRGGARTDPGASIAACALSIDLTSRSATVFTQGTPSPVYFKANGEARSIGQTGGYPLGWFSDIPIHSAPHGVSGDGTFCFWTDGLEDLAQRQGVSPLSLAHALRLAKGQKETPSWVQDAGDDILMAVVHLSANRSADRLWPLISEQYHGGQIREIDCIQESWERSLNLAVPDLPGDKLHDVLLGSREALLNALNHGCDRRPDRAASFQTTYSLQQKSISVRVADPGPGHHFDYAEHEKMAESELTQKHRGLILIKHLANAITFERGGATIGMDFHWH